jgi:transcription termination factor NusB
MQGVPTEMRVKESKELRLQKIVTKTGVELLRIVVSPSHFFLEQNPEKPSKYGVAYKKIKAIYPDFYMFWEIKADQYTGRLLTGTFLEKEDIDKFIDSILSDESYKSYEDVKDEIPG